MVSSYLTFLLELSIFASFLLSGYFLFVNSMDELKIASDIEELAFLNKYSRIPRKLMFLRESAKDKILGLALYEAVKNNRLSSSILLQAFSADFTVKSCFQLDSLDLALENQYWDLATSLIAHSIKRINLEYVEGRLIKFYKEQESQKALVLFKALPRDIRLELIDKHFGKLMNLSRNSPAYFKEGFKIANERTINNTHDAIERNGYLALHWAKNQQISNGLALLFPYLKSSDPEVKSYLYLVYYFLGLSYYKTSSWKESLRSFEEVNKLRPNYFQTDFFIKMIKEKTKGSYHESSAYDRVDLKSFSYYDTLGINPSATKEDIRKAYHKLITKYHPDKFANMGKEYQAIANEKSKELNEAYSQCLKRIKKD
jgi:hypothetical protein